MDENWKGSFDGGGIYQDIYTLEYFLQERVRGYLDPIGIDGTGYQYLAYIGSHAGCRVTDLIGVMQSDRAAVHRKLNILGGRGMLVKKTGGVDGRSFTLHLTSAGKAVVGGVEDLIARWNSDMRTGLGEDDYRALCGAIEKLCVLCATRQGRPAAQHEGLHAL